MKNNQNLSSWQLFTKTLKVGCLLTLLGIILFFIILGIGVAGIQ
jgi:hypothetical protein